MVDLADVTEHVLERGDATERTDLAVRAVQVGSVAEQQASVAAVVGSLGADAQQAVVAQLVSGQTDAVAKQDLATAAVKVLSADATQKVLTATVARMTPKQQKETLQAAARKLDPADLRDLASSLAPQGSKDRMVVYVAGFVAATLIAIGFAVVALVAGSENQGVATAAIAAAVSLPSIILGGLMGALTGR